MQANRRADTAPELRVRSELHARGLRFRKDLRLQVGTRHVRPDVVFTRRRVAVFVDGCFWHSCPEHLEAPKSNVAYWSNKLAANVERDRENDSALRAEGWTVVRVWEHETAVAAANRIAAALDTP
jgi:DNA mismatch endonuclease (patch repair protein)